MNIKSLLILASSSPNRLAILRGVDITPDQVIAPNINEERLPGEKSDKLVLRLAEAKARAVATAGSYEENAYILGADTIVGTQARVFEKAETDEDVKKYLQFFSGRRIYIKTAIAVVKIENGVISKVATKLSVSKVKFKRISPEEIELYIKKGCGLGAAGGFAIQGIGESLIQNINGSYSGIVGLPLYETVNLLIGLGYELFKN